MSIKKVVYSFQLGGLTALLLLLSYLSTSGQFYNTLIKKNGAASGDRFGFSVHWGGDTDGDGIPTEFMIGAPLADPSRRTDAGSAYVYTSNGTLDNQRNGKNAGDQLGFSVAADEVDIDYPDPWDEFFVGAPYHDTLGRTNAGKFYGWWPPLNHPYLSGHGSASNDGLGYSIAAVKDINGLNYDGYVVGAPGHDTLGLTDAGKVYAFFRGNSLPAYRIKGTGMGDSLGFSVADLGDVNADGKSDIIVGAPFHDTLGLTNVGKAYVFSGGTGALIYRIQGTGDGDLFGFSVADAGDVNADGKRDFIVGAPRHDTLGFTEVGKAYVFSGANANLLYRIRGTSPNIPPDEWFGSQFGFSVGGGKDINADGKADFIVGAPFHDTLGQNDVGKAYVFSGANSNLITREKGLASGDQFGYSVGTLEDVNSDSKADFIVGAPTADPTSLTDAGSAFVYVGCPKDKGDMNGDGAINSTDKDLLQDCVYFGTGDCNLCFADMNCNGTLTPSDVVILLNYIGGTPPPCL